MLNRILDLMKKNGITARKLTMDLEISNSSVNDWKRGSKPSCDVIIKLAHYFGVTTDFILLGIEPTSNNNEPQTCIEKNNFLSSTDSEWLSLIHQLPLEAQYEFRGELRGYLKHLNETSVAADDDLKKTGTTNSAK